MAVAMLVVTGDSSGDVDSGFTDETLNRVSFTDMIVKKRKNIVLVLSMPKRSKYRSRVGNPYSLKT